MKPFIFEVTSHLCAVLLVECAHGWHKAESGANFFCQGWNPVLLFSFVVETGSQESQIGHKLSAYVGGLGWPWISSPPASTSLVIRLQVCATTPDFMSCWSDQTQRFMYARQALYKQNYTPQPSNLLDQNPHVQEVHGSKYPSFAGSDVSF